MALYKPVFINRLISTTVTLSSLYFSSGLFSCCRIHTIQKSCENTLSVMTHCMKKTEHMSQLTTRSVELPVLQNEWCNERPEVDEQASPAGRNFHPHRHHVSAGTHNIGSRPAQIHTDQSVSKDDYIASYCTLYAMVGMTLSSTCRDKAVTC